MKNAPEEIIPSFAAAKRAFETRYVTALLKFTRGNVTQAARIAKKHRSDFHCLLRKLGVRADDFRVPHGKDAEANSAAALRSFDEEVLYALQSNGES